MKIFLQNYLEDLKQESLLTAGISRILSSDCYPLSLLIEKETQKRVSETTLKRVFGFAASCYNPSSYTLNTLAEFCGYKSWSDFLLEKEKEGLEDENHQSWATILESAHKISRFNIESNKLKSGISYNFTIHREGLDAIIDEFSASESTACVIKAPAGGGKTIAITHWIDRHINRKNETGEKDIYLLINTSTIVSSSIFSYHGNNWLSFMLGLDKVEALDQFIETYKKSAPGKFYLVIDDSNTNYISTKQYEEIFTQLIVMTNHFSHLKWFKIIISIRMSIFHKYRYLIERNPPIQIQWHITNCRLGGFSTEEIDELSTKLIGKRYSQPCSPISNGAFIDLPLHFQIYYQLKGDNICPESLTTADQFMIANTYINNYILKGASAHEKRSLLNRLSRYVKYNGKTLVVDEHTGTRICKQFQSAFKELSNAGFIFSYHTNNGRREIAELRFQSTIFGSYFLAQRILTKNRETFDANLINLINASHYPNAIKIELLHWLIEFAIEGNHFDFFDHIHVAEFTKSKELSLVLFIHDNFEILKNDAFNKDHLIRQINERIANSSIVDYMLLYFSTDRKYEQALEQALEYSLSTQQRILIHSALGLIALSRMEGDRLKFHLDQMKQIDPMEYRFFALNPYTQLNALYRYFKAGEVCRKALKEITAFNFNPFSDNDQHCHQIIHSLGVLVSQMSSGERKTLRFLQAIEKSKLLNKVTFSLDYVDFLQLTKARQWLKKNNIEKASSLQFTNPVTMDHNILIQITYSIYKMELAVAKGEKMNDYVKEITKETLTNNLSFIEVFVKVFYLKLLKDQKASSKDIALQEADVKTLLAPSGFQLESFVKWANIAF